MKCLKSCVLFGCPEVDKAKDRAGQTFSVTTPLKRISELYYNLPELPSMAHRHMTTPITTHDIVEIGEEEEEEEEVWVRVQRGE